MKEQATNRYAPTGNQAADLAYMIDEGLQHTKEFYLSLIQNLFEKMPILQKDQVISYLMNADPSLPHLKAEGMLAVAERDAMIMVSTDGWVMTKPAYNILTGDKFYDKVHMNNINRLEDMEGYVKANGKYLIDENTRKCFWLIADNLPDSINFVRGENPWFLSFQTSPNDEDISYLVQITYFPDNISLEYGRVALIKNDMNKLSKTFIPYMKRIALMENPDPEHAEAVVPYLGFQYICTLNPDDPSGYDVITEREDIWKDWK